jgi:hypothetical protein
LPQKDLSIKDYRIGDLKRAFGTGMGGETLWGQGIFRVFKALSTSTLLARVPPKQRVGRVTIFIYYAYTSYLTGRQPIAILQRT